MANRMEEPIRALGKRYVIVAGSFAPNGASAISAASNKGKGFTAARTDVGAYLITFTDKWTDLVSVTFTQQRAAVADGVPQAGTYDASAKTLVVTNLVGATPTEIAANANNRIHFLAIFRNTSITGGTSA